MTRSQALEWATRSGAHEAEVNIAWRTGHAVSVPVGRCWEVVRATRTLGIDTVLRLQAHGLWLGPVLEVPPRGTVEILVPTGTARTWPALPGTVCTARGTMRSPAPYLTAAGGHRARCGRRWIVPPLLPAPATTDPDALCETAAAALAHAALLLHDDPRTPRP
ncbi:hypothetical protein [Streptomyces sp. TR02-1]|uniref:hypothetical protein n=1 Tax=Streptomyces sp. TR02-1 TaxID=3385977 RepID=UPI0039A373C9